MTNNKFNLNISGVLILLATLVLYVLRVTEVIHCSYLLVFVQLAFGPAILLLWVIVMLIWLVVLTLLGK